jgi:cyclic pyranopterin phosphate synthase
MEKGQARMVDVSRKAPTKRTASATGVVLMTRDTLELVLSGGLPKGDVLTSARVAGIMAAKKTPEIVPLCHPLEITSVSVDLVPNKKRGELRVMSTVTTVGRTGVEMEALTAVSAAALTVYDMCKSIDKEMKITDIVLEEKKGGRSGHYKRKK